MIVLIDAGGRISWVSPSAGQLLGSEPSELTGTDVLSIVHEENQAAVIAGIEAVMRGESVRVEYRVQNEAGDWIWLESTGHDLPPDPDAGATLPPPRHVTDRHRPTEEPRRRPAHHPRPGPNNRARNGQ